MSSSRFALLCSVPLLAAALGCPSQPTSAKPVPTKAKAPANKDAAAAGPKAVAPPAAAPAAPAAPAAAPTPAPAPAAAPEAASTPQPSTDDNPALGRQFMDPRWFRKTMFGDKGKALDTKRSEADEAGRFSSMIRFELTDTTVEQCADELTKQVQGDIPTIERTEKDGRITMRGDNGEFEITFMCGEAGGKSIAYVSYKWL
ncbi:MAG: hypothetical protein AAF799_30125 [Myxococcota bacterium]